MKVSTWDKTLEIERDGEGVLDAIFGAEFIIVRATRQHQKQKIDRFHINRQDGRIIYRVDYKVDEKAGTTQRLALEHVSVLERGILRAQGWIHTTIADRIVSYVPKFDTAYILPVAMLRSRWAEIQEAAAVNPQTGEKLWWTSTIDHDTKRSYQTGFYPVPIRWLKEHGFIETEVSAIGAQFRLNLRMSQ